MINKSVCVVDTGFFVSMAEVLTKHFKKVYYFSPWESGYSKSQDLLIGSGLNGVERVKYFWDIEADLYIFPDYCFPDWQEKLKRDGKLVWGFGKTNWLEADRIALREWQEQNQLEVPAWKQFIGIDELKEGLKPDSYIKLSEHRADMETLKHYNDKCSEQFFDELAVTLGIGKHTQEFIAEKKIKGDTIEPGYDTWTIDGKSANKLLAGYEIKDEAYIGKWTEMKFLPKAIQEINNKLNTLFAKEKTKGFYSTEVIMPDQKTGYLLDFTARNGNPPFQLYMSMIDNLGEILWYGAQGQVVEPKLKALWGAVAIINSDFASHNQTPIQVTDEAKPFTFLMNKCIYEDMAYVIPKQGLSEIGAVVGLGRTLDEAIEHCKKNADGIQGYQLEIDIASLDKAKEVIKKGVRYGILL